MKGRGSGPGTPGGLVAGTHLNRIAVRGLPLLRKLR